MARRRFPCFDIREVVPNVHAFSGAGQVALQAIAVARDEVLCVSHHLGTLKRAQRGQAVQERANKGTTDSVGLLSRLPT